LLVAFAWLVFYICRLYGRYRLLSKALDKVAPERVPEVAVFINGGQALPRRSGSARGAPLPGDGGAGAEEGP
jgi:hypothetical protein